MSSPAAKPLETILSCVYIWVLPQCSHHSHANISLKEDILQWMEGHRFPCSWRLCYYIQWQVVLCTCIPRVTCRLWPFQLNRCACGIMEWIGAVFPDFSLLDGISSCWNHLFIRESCRFARYWDSLSVVSMIPILCSNRNFLHLWNWRFIKENPKLVSICQLQTWKT